MLKTKVVITLSRDRLDIDDVSYQRPSVPVQSDFKQPPAKQPRQTPLEERTNEPAFKLQSKRAHQPKAKSKTYGLGQA